MCFCHCCTEYIYSYCLTNCHISDCQPQAQALFDIRVIDTYAPSQVNRSVAAILASAEAEKKKKYNNAANAR